MIEKFIQDYIDLSYWELMNKYGNPEADYPSSEEVLDHLKKNNSLEIAFDAEPNEITTEGFTGPYLVRRASGKLFVVLNRFRGLDVCEAEFNDMDEAIKEKFNRILTGIRGSNRR